MSPRLFALLGVLLTTAACQEPPPPAPPTAAPVRPPSGARRYFGGAPDGKLHVYFFDVGHGDAALIVSPEGHTVLVDSGPTTAADHLVNRLPELLTQPLDLVVLTHPHADHHGGLEAVARRVGMKQLMEPQLGATPPEYDALLTTLSTEGVEFLSPAPPPSTPNAPLRLTLGTGVELNVLWPRLSKDLLEVPEAPLEANSIVLRLTYGDTALLFAGDAHARTEAQLLSRGTAMKATLLKVAAHGADGPSTEAFLRVVEPRVAVISSGPGNTRGVPSAATLRRLTDVGAQVFRTDVTGEVQVVSDGRTLVVTPQRLPAGMPDDTRYTFSGLSAVSAPVAKAADAKVEPPTEADPTTPPTPQGPRGTTDLTRYGQQTVDIDALPTVDAPPLPRTEARPPRGSTEPRGTSSGVYVASSKGEVFHLPWCRNAKRIKPTNKLLFQSREEAGRDGRRPARDCNP